MRPCPGIPRLICRNCGHFCLECLNRYEGYLLNTARKGMEFVQEADVPSVKLLLDTFHMNIEEDSMPDAILTAGPYLQRLHTGKSNRRIPGQGGLPWNDIGRALRVISFQGDVVMEPFVRAGGTIGREIKVWRQLADKVDEESLDHDALRALQFSRFVLGRQKSMTNRPPRLGNSPTARNGA